MNKPTAGLSKRGVRFSEWDARIKSGLDLATLSTFDKLDLLEDGWMRSFQRYDHFQRSSNTGNFRMHHLQRQAIGEFFWIHLAASGTAFRSRKTALITARRNLGLEQESKP